MTNIYLQESEYVLLQDLPARELTKRRYSFLHDERKFSIDVFEGKLEGLILCEIEILVDDNSPLNLPDFLGEEVTNDKDYLASILLRNNSV